MGVPVAVAVATQMVQIVAPGDLPEGYSFHAVYSGTTFVVTVPEGGVKEGQIMTVPFDPVTVATQYTPLKASIEWTPDGVVESSHWKDGLCDCCKFGICHPSFLYACCVPQILMAQVLTRLKMNMWGDPAPESEYKVTFRRMLILVAVFAVLSTFLQPPDPEVEQNEDGSLSWTEAEIPVWQYIVYHLITTLFYLYTLILLIKIRVAVRNRYKIPEQHCAGMEDCCCAFWCGCCTVAQVARQTADYDQSRAVCCSSTGLPASTTVVIV